VEDDKVTITLPSKYLRRCHKSSFGYNNMFYVWIVICRKLAVLYCQLYLVNLWPIVHRKNLCELSNYLHCQFESLKQHNPNHNPRTPVKGHYFTFTLMKTLFGYVLLEEGFVRQLRYIDTTNDGSVNSTSDPLLVSISLEDNPL
jgi:hypothetical protein